MSEIETLLDAIDSTRVQDLRWEIKALREIRDWALEQLPIHAGDQVRITHPCLADPIRSWGWMAYREALAFGATGTVLGVHFSGSTWQAEVRLDREWSVSADGSRRWWKGPGAPPDGYQDARRGEEDRRGRFWISLDHLERVTSDAALDV